MKMKLTAENKLILGAIRVCIGSGSWTQLDLSLWSIITECNVRSVKDSVTSLRLAKLLNFREEREGVFEYAISIKGVDYLPEKSILLTLYKRMIAYNNKEPNLPKKTTDTVKPATEKTSVAKPKAKAKAKAKAKKETAKVSKKAVSKRPAKTSPNPVVKKVKKVKTAKVPNVVDEANGVKRPTRGLAAELWAIFDKAQGRAKKLRIDKKIDAIEAGDYRRTTVAVYFSSWKKYRGF